MADVISKIYSILGGPLVLISDLSQYLVSSNRLLLVGIALVLGIIAVIMLLIAVKKHGSYKLYVKLSVGAVFIGIITRYAIREILNSTAVTSNLTAYLECMILAGAIGFIIVNFMLDQKNGSEILLLWGSELLTAITGVMLWSFVMGNQGMKGTPDFGSVMFLSEMVRIILEQFNILGVSTLIFIAQYIVLMFLMFGTVFLLSWTKPFAKTEWRGAVVSQIMIAASYLIFEAHGTVSWDMGWAFWIFMTFFIGIIWYVFLFCYEVSVKDQDGCIGIFFIGMSGILLSCAAVIAVHMAQGGNFEKLMNGISGFMTGLYEKIPVGRHTVFNQGSAFFLLTGVIIACLIAAILMMLLFMVLNKVINFSEQGAGLSANWYRNCTMLLIVPLNIYWLCSLYGNIFGDHYVWVKLLIQSMTGLGGAICISNLAPGLIKNRFFAQVKMTGISVVASLVICCLVVPVVLAMI